MGTAGRVAIFVVDWYELSAKTRREYRALPAAEAQKKIMAIVGGSARFATKKEADAFAANIRTIYASVDVRRELVSLEYIKRILG